MFRRESTPQEFVLRKTKENTIFRYMVLVILMIVISYVPYFADTVTDLQIFLVFVNVFLIYLILHKSNLVSDRLLILNRYISATSVGFVSTLSFVPVFHKTVDVLAERRDRNRYFFYLTLNTIVLICLTNNTV